MHPRSPGDDFPNQPAHRISRRQVVTSAMLLGLAAGMVPAVRVAAQESTPGVMVAGRPSRNTDRQTRGEGGDLRIIQWQAPGQLSALHAIGANDRVAASLVSEPLMLRGDAGQLLPNLVTEVPTVENGLLAEDFSRVTFNLLAGVRWSDGEPFTANDVAFTLDFILDRKVEAAVDASGTSAPVTTNGVVGKVVYQAIDSWSVENDQRITVTFTHPAAAWSEPFTGSGISVVYPRHILEGRGQTAIEGFRTNPVGTGPYKVEEFVPNERVTYALNEHYREPTKPFFSKVILQGGGTAGEAARKVVQAGEYDLGWNIDIEPELAKSLDGDDNPGILLVAPSLGVERININFSDPRQEVNGQVSEVNTPNPVLSDPAVRQAMKLAIHRSLIANAYYFGGKDEPAISNILSGIPSMASKTNKLVFNQAEAAEILTRAGWVLDGNVRKKDGVELAVTFQANIDQVRQKVQRVVKEDLEAVGFRVDLVQTSDADFFSTDPQNGQGASQFASDLNIWQASVGAPPPLAYMAQWFAGDNDENIAQASNGWTGLNTQRYRNPDYDDLFRAAQAETDLDELDQLFIAMNDLLVSDAVVVPLVKVKKRLAVSRTLNLENLAPNRYELDYWNIANWNRVDTGSQD